MSVAAERPKVAILAMPEVTSSMVYGMYDLFASAGRDWGFLVKGEAGEQRMRPYVVSRQRGEFRALNDIWIRPDHSLHDCPAPDIICLPDIMSVPGESIAGKFEEEVTWLRKCHDSGATLASACTGALLLAETGLLDGF